MPVEPAPDACLRDDSAREDEGIDAPLTLVRLGRRRVGKTPRTSTRSVALVSTVAVKHVAHLLDDFLMLGCDPPGPPAAPPREVRRKYNRRRSPVVGLGRESGREARGAMPLPSDEVLVRRIRSGDAEAARALYERHAVSLRAHARRKLPRELRARVGESDVIQDACVAAFERLGDFEDRGQGSFARWIFGILDHKVVDQMRHHVEAQKRSARREVRDSRLRLAAHERTPSREVADAEVASLLRAMLEGLPENHRTILELVHDGGLTLAAAGVRMGRSPDAARMLYGRAIAKLAQRLGRRQGPSP